MNENIWHKYRKFIANALSFARPIATALLILYIINNGEAAYSWPTAIVWAIIAITDKFDGTVAKRFGSTKNGATIDEMMDKVTNFMAFLALASLGRIGWYFVSAMIIRDVVVIFIRRWAKSTMPESPVKSAKNSGKFKTFLQSVLIFAAVMPTIPHHAVIVYFCAALATMASIISGMEILIRVLNARDPEWLKGTDGRIGAPNWVSLYRMGLAMIIPTIYVSRPFGKFSNIIALIVLIAAISTDALDGYLARTRNELTKAGKQLDPLCDKIIFYPAIAGMFFANFSTIMSDFFIESSHFASAIILSALAISAFIIVLRDAGFIGWYFLSGRRIPEGISADICDKVRMGSLCAILGIVAIMLILHEPFGFQSTVLSFVLFWAFLVSMILSVVTIFVSLERIKQFKVAS